VLRSTVSEIRRRRGWISPLQKRRSDFAVGGYLTATALAARLSVGLDWVYYRLKNGLIDMKYLAPHTHQRAWLIKEDLGLIDELRSEVARGRKQGRQVQEH
jgi:uncharacterized Fe-S cluster-containing radical SAM superfamily protein